MLRGFVALLDVLGFSSLIMAGDAPERLTRYLGTIRETLRQGAEIEYVVFSDTIVLTTGDDSDQSFLALLKHSSALFGSLLKEGIALRGAITCGSFVRENTSGGVFVAGRAIVEAYSFENQQDWVGIMLAPSTIHRFPDLEQRCLIDPPGSSRSTEEGMKLIVKQSACSSFVQRCRNIPFHSSVPFASNNFDGFALTPSSGIATASALATSLGESLKALEFLKSVAPDPHAQSKYWRAINWLDTVQRHWHDVANWQARLDAEKKSS